VTRGRAAEAAPATALLLVVALQVHTLDDSDTWWHLASGRLIAAERVVARADPFSFTAPGAPWINQQWLFDLAAYGTWRAGGTGRQTPALSARRPRSASRKPARPLAS